MNIVVICYLYGSLLVYLVTGGADFGAGVVELFTPAADKKHVRELMRKLTSPIWEADHMWLILAIVILFVGFPDIYAQISTALFIPISILLLGIVGRGTSYAFRNADDSVHDQFKHADNVIYVSSSVVALFSLGVIASSILSGYKPADGSFAAIYVYNWFNYFPISAGILTVVFCGYLAMTYALARFPAERHYLKSRFLLLSIMLFAAVLVVVCNPVFRMILPGWVVSIPMLVVIILLTAIVLYLMWKLVFSDHSKWARLFAIVPVIFILLVLSHTDGTGTDKEILHLPLKTNPDYSKTTDGLGIILIIATFLIVPALGYLLYKFELPNFKKNNLSTKPE